MKEKSEQFNDQYQQRRNMVTLSYRMFNQLLQKSTTQLQKCSYIIWLCCVILIIDLIDAKQINRNIDINIVNQYHKIYHQLGDKQQQCLIGIEIESINENGNSLLATSGRIVEVLLNDTIITQLPHKWKYCLIKHKGQLAKGWRTQFSRDWQQCLHACCATIFSDQCYFKASSSPPQPINKFTLFPKLRNHYISSQQDNNNGLIVDKMRLLQSDSNSNGDGNVSNGGEIVLIIITCIFGVPLLLLIIFAIISIVKLCRLRSMENAENIGGNGQQEIQDIIAQEVNLDLYKMQQMGPYHVNIQQQCPICLDESVNLRTRCGHFYHPQCIKAWIIRGRSRCPVCNCTRLNPMKVYCKRCYVGVKLVVLDRRTEDKIVQEIAVLECENCGSEDVGVSQKKGKGGEISGGKINSSVKAKKGDGPTTAAKQKSAQRARHHPRISRVTQPHKPQRVNPSSSSSSNQQQLNVIPVQHISHQHNQNQFIQSLGLRASTHHFLRQPSNS